MLHSVCIHEGSADSGHYYTYIKDHAKDKWRKFNDHRVDEVEEGQVFGDANGGSVRSAYYLVYISQAELRIQLRADFNLYDSETEERNFREHPYA